MLTPHMKPKPLMNNPDKTANLQTNATARTNVPNEVKMWIDNKASIPLALDLQAFNKTKHIVHRTKLNHGRTAKTTNHQNLSDYLTRPDPDTTRPDPKSPQQPTEVLGGRLPPGTRHDSKSPQQPTEVLGGRLPPGNRHDPKSPQQPTEVLGGKLPPGNRNDPDHEMTTNLMTNDDIATRPDLTTRPELNTNDPTDPN